MPICKRDAPRGRLVRTQYPRKEGLLYAALFHPYGVSRATHRTLWLRGRGQGTLLRCDLPLHEEVNVLASESREVMNHATKKKQPLPTCSGGCGN